ncbi:MAG: YgiT-type zinc finger protein [Anaerolineaceae bacterium]|jgi:YgiT-type zinc finger domain-containing protein
MRSPLPPNPETCPRCYVGRIKQQPVTLTTIVSGELLSVPNFPAWVCDVCHAFMYDPKALADLNAFLSKPKLQTQPRKLSGTKSVKKAPKRTLSSGN